MQSAQTIGFHESTIVGFCRENKTLMVELQGVHLGDEICSAVISLKGIELLTCDGVEVENLVMEAEDGEVLTLQHTQTTLHLIVEWNDFKQHKSNTRSYRVNCGSVEIEMGPGRDAATEYV